MKIVLTRLCCWRWALLRPVRHFAAASFWTWCLCLYCALQMHSHTDIAGRAGRLTEKFDCIDDNLMITRFCSCSWFLCFCRICCLRCVSTANETVVCVQVLRMTAVGFVSLFGAKSVLLQGWQATVVDECVQWCDESERRIQMIFWIYFCSDK